MMRLRYAALLLVGLWLAASSRAQILVYAVDSPSPGSGGTGAGFGRPLTSVPDLDGDGVADLLVGAPSASSVLTNTLGRAYAFSGATGAPLDTLISATPTEEGRFGSSVAGLPDLDGDGRGDYLIGAPGEARAYVISGITETLIATLQSPSGEATGYFGHAVAAVPDADGDGVTDLAVAAPFETVGGLSRVGRVYLFSGATRALLQTFVSVNPEADVRFGLALAGQSDTDGDGRGDVAVFAFDTVNGLADAGRVYRFSGATGVPLRVFPSQVPEAGAGFGSRLAALPDVTGDGRADLLVGSRRETIGGSRVGRVYVYGITSAPVLTLESPSPEPNGNFGIAVAAVPDVTGDGLADLVVGASGEGPAGRAYLFASGTGTLLLTLTPPAGSTADLFGDAVAGLPDVTGDGRPDVAVGDPFAQVGSTDFAGRAYVFDTSLIVAGAPPPGAAGLLSLSVAPNPSRGAASLTFSLDAPGAVRLTLHDALGRSVAILADGARAAGSHTVPVDLTRRAAGVYVARLATGGTVSTARLAVAR